MIKAQFRAYSPEGFEMLVDISADNAADLRQSIKALQANGITAALQVPNMADKEAVITTVVRRDYQKAGKRKRVIDCYPDRMKWRFISIYLDDDKRAIDEFEKHSGLTLEKMPVFNSQTALERDFQYPQDCEVQCGFSVKKSPQSRVNEAGETEIISRFAGYTSGQVDANQIPF